MKVTQLKNNQFSIYHENNFYFQSYETLIAIYNEYDYSLMISCEYNYSRTTSKYFNQWINIYVEIDVTELKKKIKNYDGKPFFIKDKYGNQVHVYMVNKIYD